MPVRATLNFVYASIVQNMDQKEREEFDSTLNSGVSGSSWARIEAEAWARLEAGEFEQSGGES